MTTNKNKSSFANFFGGIEPSDFLFEDEQCVVFDEQNCKQAPVHFLVVPKRTIPKLMATTVDDEQLLGHLLLVAKQIALDMGLDKSGYHVMVDVNHRDEKLKSIHVFGRALHHMVWPIGPGSRL